jgi:uncharacterized membrane protein (TIGR02234 family)
MTGQRRTMIAALTGCVAGAGLVLLAASQPWAGAIVADLPGGGRIDPSGGTVAPLASGLALAALAGPLAVLATRGVGRLAVGVLLVVAGSGIAVVAVRTAADATAAVSEPAAAAVGLSTPAIYQAESTGWPYVAALGGLAVATAGVATIARGRGWPSMSARYERPDRQPATARPASMWDAIGRGEDPTK